LWSRKSKVDFYGNNSNDYQPDASNYIALANGGGDDPYANNRAVYNALLGLGVPDRTAAGAVGSLMGEGGRYLDAGAVNPEDGADGSDSIGFGQWNGPRAQALKATAAQMGLDPTDPQAQVQHLINELSGPYAHVLDKLKNAPNSIESGSDIWTRHYEVPANADSKIAARTGFGYQFADALGNGSSASPAIGNTDYASNSGAQSGGTGDVNTVSTNADNTGVVQGAAPALSPFLDPTAYAATADANPILGNDAIKALSKAAPLGSAPASKSDDDESDDSDVSATTGKPTASDLFDKLKQSGIQAPGAYVTGLLNSFLNSGGASKPDANNGDMGKFGNTLVRVGAALMARDNPSGAQALLNAIPKEDKDKDKTPTVRSAQVIANGQGQSFVRNIMSDGTVKVTPLKPGEVSPAEIAKSNPQAKEKPLTGIVQRGIADSTRNMSSSINQYEDALELQKALQEGKLNVTWNKQGTALIDNSLGHSNENSRDMKKLNSLVNRIALTTAQMQKGGNSDFRMKMDIQSTFPPGAKLDNVTAYESLDRLKSQAMENYSGASSQLNSIVTDHPSVEKGLIINGLPINKLNDFYSKKHAAWDKTNADLQENYYDWVKQHDNPTAGQPTAPSVGVARPGSAFSGSPAGAANNAAGAAAAMSGAEPSLSGGGAPVPAPAAPQTNAAPKLSPGAQSILDAFRKKQQGN
jgi:hypothetical protein